MVKIKRVSFFIYLLFCALGIKAQEMEHLDRGVVAIRTENHSVFISWRLLKCDPSNIAFEVYRKIGNEPPLKINSIAIVNSTCFVDSINDISENLTYYVCNSNEEKTFSKSNSFELNANQVRPYLSIPLQIPEPAMVEDKVYTYSANDASVGDLDGDGKYEIVLKWQPSLTRNPPQPGLTGLQILDAYKMDGTLMWRINLGKNIRAGAAYTQFLVYDFDDDGKAEIICKTADGTIDGLGTVIGDGEKDWRDLNVHSKTYGKVLTGSEYLTVFSGETGKALSTKEYIPSRYPLDGWGGIGGNGRNDNTGGRSDRFTAGVAYLDGAHPSAVFVRGWYGRTVVVAWDFRNGELSNRWVFDSKDAKNPYSGQGNHSICVADMDEDGKDEFCVGAMTVDDNGEGLYSTGLRHGDALHLADMNLDESGLEIYGIHENEGKTIKLGTPGVAMYSAKTGKVIFGIAPGIDVGRGVSADIDPRYRGFENWGGPGGLRDANGKTICKRTPSSTNFLVWWDGDLLRELLDDIHIDKWGWKTETCNNLLTARGCSSNNGSKGTPCLSGDILGDWREEVIWRSKDNKELRIYTSSILTDYRFVTLMHDRQYRLSIAWQNVAYNQPPHTGFYLGYETGK